MKINRLLYLRRGPSINSGRVAMLFRGTDVTLLGRSEGGSWVKVRAADGSEGWLYARWIDADVMTLNVVREKRRSYLDGH